MFSCEFCEISKNIFLQNTSGRLLLKKISLKLVNHTGQNIIKWFSLEQHLSIHSNNKIKSWKQKDVEVRSNVKVVRWSGTASVWKLGIKSVYHDKNSQLVYLVFLRLLREKISLLFFSNGKKLILYCLYSIKFFQKLRPVVSEMSDVFYEKDVLKNFAKVAGKHVWEPIF